MQVEVCVQESFDEVFELELNGLPAANSSSSRCTISVETWEDWFQKWLEALQPDFSPIQSYELSLRLTGDREIQALNAQYCQRNQPTDVLAFAALETEGPPSEEIITSLPLYLGDIVISVDTAQRQAKAQQHLLETELAWLATHGLLHLLGWDHPDDDSLTRMLNQQQALLQIVGFRLQTS